MRGKRVFLAYLIFNLYFSLDQLFLFKASFLSLDFYLYYTA